MLKTARLRTRLGWFAWIESEAGLEILTLGNPTAHSAQAMLEAAGWNLAETAPLESPALAEALLCYSEGEPVDFRAFRVAMDSPDTFRGRVLAACRRIPWGATMTYGQLAAEAGSPGAARAAGNCMAQNRVPLVIPCHRVVASGGRIGQYSAPGGTAMKQRLLRLEGYSETTT